MILIHENTVDLVKCNDTEQFSRRSCLRIHGVGVKEKESEDDIMNTLEQCYSSLDVPFNPIDINRDHRIGGSYTDSNSGKKVKSIIVKFRSWKARQFFHKCRSRYHTDGSKKPGFSV